MDLCMEIPTGVMVSPASLASLGSARASHSSHLEASPSILAKRRIHVVSSLNFNKSGGRQRWVLQYRGISFKCNVITNLIDEKGVSSSIESVFLACSADKEDNTDLILNATANSVSHDEPIGAIKLKNSATSNDGVLTGKRLETRDDNRETVLKPLREVLGKAGKVDKLETENMKNPAKLNDIEIRSNAKQNGGFKPHRPVKTNNVWRRGDPMKNIHNEVREVPRISTEELEEAKSPLISKTSEQDPSSANVLKLQKPIPVPPTNKFASKEPIADLITSETVLATTKPVKGLLSKSKERWKRSSVAKSLQNGMIKEINVITSDEDPVIHKHQKPIPVSPTDKFESKEPIADLITTEAVLATTKPVKGLLSKSKECWKRSSVAGGLQNGMIEEINVMTSDEDPVIQKHQKPIPVSPTDKFESKEPIADLVTTEAVLATTKPLKGLLSKSKERWTRSSVAGGLQNGMIEQINVITPDEDPIIHKHQKPILVSPPDKFASKEQIADLITSETVLATTKPVKGLLSKSKERWTRSSVPEGLQNGMIEQINVITPDEDPIIHKHHSIEGRKPTLIDKFSMKKPVIDSIASEVRKPTLIDKFSIKKPVVDSNASEGELTLTKPIKGPPTKVKEEHKKKFSVDGNLQKREVDDDDVDIIKEDPIIQKPHNTKPRRPILIDNFSSKKSVGDSIVSEAVIASTKSVDGLSSKLKVEHSKTSSDVGGLHKRLAEENDAAIIVEDALETDVPISAVSKGKKWTKASRKAARHKAAKTDAPVKAEILEVGNEGMYIEELAYNLAVNEVEIIEYLCSKGIKSETVRVLDKDMVKMICKDYDVEVIEAQITLQEMAKKKEILDEEDLNMLEVRPPVITIMGHVDHGKTTLLDCIRNSKVVASEFGGITQGIGAYKVQVIVDSKPQYCVFLDTPGHEAFGAMRARGARVTDITIIVVAADDGVCPQTTEAIAHAKAAEVPIVIAINKMDKDGADPDRVMQELSHAGLMPEEWGGHIPMVKISALKNENVDQLLETVMLVAEMQELKANPHRKAKGTCIEAGLEKQRGPVSTFIVQNGTLRKGDIVVCGEAFGKARALFDDRGIHVDEVGPSMAVQVIGLSKVPIAGDEFEIVSSLDLARKKAETCAESLWASRLTAKAAETKITLSSLASAVSAGKQSGVDRHQLNIILKADVQGSIEAIKQALHVLPQDNVTLKFLHKAPGGVSASDVDLAVVAKAIIFGFNVKALGSVKKYADQKNVEIRLYRVIYDLIDEMRKAMEGLLESAEEQIPVGVAKVRATFSSGSGRVAGCMITEGKLMKGCSLRVVRNGMTIYTGVISSLRRIKEVVEEVGAGLECGVGVDTFSDWAIQDVIEAFQTIKKRRTLEEASASVTAALAGAGIER